MLKKILLFVFIILVLSAALWADDVAVTVYNNNLGVVSETRLLELQKGLNRLAFRDVPSMIDANSVTFEVVGDKSRVAILEQNYAYDLVSPDKMYEKYIDQEIELVDKDGRLFNGTLLAYGGGAVTLQEKSGRVKIVALNNITEVNFPLLPEGLITRPTLFWLYQSEAGGKKDCRVGYQTSGMTWSAEYVGVLDAKETGLGLSGWAAINNTSGKTYQDATLKLIAGDIHRAQAPVAPRVKMMATDAEMSGAGFEEKAFFEYHLYTLPRKATLADKEIKQISLFDPAHASVVKEYLYRPERNPEQVEVSLNLMNSKKSGLGLPLPAGRVRLFKADDDGSMVLLGEDRIDHTPKDEELNLKVGYAFDIAAEERLVTQNQVSSKVEEREYEVELRNHKDSDITVKVEKQLYGIWDLLSANYEHKQKDANMLMFDVPVAADTVAILKYKIRFTYR
ncbi:MAG: DUF4139 domain-containing protein [Candidatus Zixiibacteriota bacterium]